MTIPYGRPACASTWCWPTARTTPGGDWARAQLATLARKSPPSLKVTFRELREGEEPGPSMIRNQNPNASTAMATLMAKMRSRAPRS
jgi:hypothetical protein